METKRTTWFITPLQIKRLLGELIEKIEQENCFSTDELKRMQRDMSWFNTPRKINEIVQQLKSHNYPIDIESTQWSNFIHHTNELRDEVIGFECSKIEAPEGTTILTLTQYSETGDLNEDAQPVDITVYLAEDRLYENPTLEAPFLDQPGDYYYVTEGNTTEQTIRVDIDGNVTDKDYDIESPTVPQNLTSSNIRQTEFQVNWDVSTDNEGVEEYKVYLDGTEEQTVTTTSTTIDSLTHSTEYQVEVSSVDTSGNESDKSTALQVTTSDIPQVQNLTTTNVTETTVTLTWNAPTQTERFSHYEVKQDGSTIENNHTDTTLTVSDLTPNTQYQYEVLSIYDEEPVPTEGVTTTTTTLPEPVVSNISTSNVADTTVDVSWNAPTNTERVNYYQIVDGTTVIEDNITTLNTSLGELTPETTYNLAVRTVYEPNMTSQGVSFTVTTTATPIPEGIVQNLSSSNETETSVDISWDAPDTPETPIYYVVQLDGNEVESNVTTTSTTITDLTAGTDYTVTVLAVYSEEQMPTEGETIDVTTLSEPEPEPEE